MVLKNMQNSLMLILFFTLSLLFTSTTTPTETFESPACVVKLTRAFRSLGAYDQLQRIDINLSLVQSMKIREFLTDMFSDKPNPRTVIKMKDSGATYVIVETSEQIDQEINQCQNLQAKGQDNEEQT